MYNLYEYSKGTHRLLTMGNIDFVVSFLKDYIKSIELVKDKNIFDSIKNFHELEYILDKIDHGYWFLYVTKIGPSQ